MARPHGEKHANNTKGRVCPFLSSMYKKLKCSFFISCAYCYFREILHFYLAIFNYQHVFIFFLTYPARTFMINIIFKRKVNIKTKLMTKRSTCVRSITESCRWWDCSIQQGMEWTWEGGSKEPAKSGLSNAQRDFRPLSRESA